MKKLLALILGIYCQLAFAVVNQVNFLNWGDYIASQSIPHFEKLTGITVNQSYFDGSDMLRAMLMAGDTNYDLAVPALVDMKLEIPAGVFEPIDKSKIPNWRYRNKALYNIAAKIDPDNRYGVIYAWGTTGIAENISMIKKVLGPNAPIHSWKIILDPKYLKKLKRCGVSFIDSPTQLFGITFHYLGINPDTTKPKDFIRAANYLMTLRPYITYFSNNRYINDLSAGNLCIAIGYSGDITRARLLAIKAHDNVDIHYVLPKSGAPIWFDMLAMPKGAPHPQATYQFINYLLSPKVAAANSNYIFYPNAVLSSAPFLSPVFKNPSITPPATLIKKLFILEDAPLRLNQLVTSLWFEVKYGIKLGSG